jgi:hypothetical protein
VFNAEFSRVGGRNILSKLIGRFSPLLRQQGLGLLLLLVHVELDGIVLSLTTPQAGAIYFL